MNGEVGDKASKTMKGLRWQTETLVGKSEPVEMLELKNTSVFQGRQSFSWPEIQKKLLT